MAYWWVGRAIEIMNTYVVRTGNYRMEVEAVTPDDAALIAFRKEEPILYGELTQVHLKGGLPEDFWYQLTEVFLEQARERS